MLYIVTFMFMVQKYGGACATRLQLLIIPANGNRFGFSLTTGKALCHLNGLGISPSLLSETVCHVTGK